jgi:hypothetical protein
VRWVAVSRGASSCQHRKHHIALTIHRPMRGAVGGVGALDTPSRMNDRAVGLRFGQQRMQPRSYRAICVYGLTYVAALGNLLEHCRPTSAPAAGTSEYMVGSTPQESSYMTSIDGWPLKGWRAGRGAVGIRGFVRPSPARRQERMRPDRVAPTRFGSHRSCR